MRPWLTAIIFLKSWFPMISSEVTFQSSVGSEKEDTFFQKGAVLIYANQAVTSESDSKVTFFTIFTATSIRPCWSPPLEPGCSRRGASKSHSYRSEKSRSRQSHHGPILLPVRNIKITSITPRSRIILYPCTASSKPMICWQSWQV